MSDFISYECFWFNKKMTPIRTITGAQVRAARSLLRWSAEDLAAAAGVGISTIRRAEQLDGAPTITIANLKVIQMTFEAAGIEFIAENGGGVGVRFSKPKS